MFLGYALPWPRGSRTELELMLFHPHSSSLKRHAFGFQAHPLFEPRFTRQPDSSASSQHSMPRQSPRVSERPDNLARGARESGGFRNVAIGGNLAPWDFANRIADDAQHDALYQASVRRKPCSSVYWGLCPRSRRAAVVSACES